MSEDEIIVDKMLGSMTYDKSLEDEEYNLLIQQYLEFCKISERNIDLSPLIVDDNGNPLLKEGMLLHGTSFNQNILLSIKQKGIVSSEFIGEYEDGETFYCADFYRVPFEYITVFDYIKWINTRDITNGVTSLLKKIECSKLPYRTKENFKDYSIAMVIDSNIPELETLLSRDVYRENDTFDSMKKIVNFQALTGERMWGNKDRLSAVLYGIPSNAINGFIVSEYLSCDNEKMEFIMQLFPNSYIITNQGKIVYNPNKLVNTQK